MPQEPPAESEPPPDIPDEETERLYNSCPSCSAALDVTDLEPYAKIVCESCGETIRIRQQFDEFLITEKLGEGGMSRVFRAFDTLLNREVALKILNEEFSRDQTRITQFEKEARITAGISHPNVVRVFKVGRDQGFFYIAMELVGGGSLEEKIKSNEELSEDRVLEIAAQVAQGLRAAKSTGLIHRDIKPGNILFTQDGTGKIVDFGLSLIHGKEVDDSGEIWATPYYVPPEQLFDQPEDFRGDMYSLGATLFHVLAKKPPYEADTNSLEKLRKIKSQTVRLGPVAPHVSPKTRQVIDRTLELDPDKRFPDYNSLLEGISDARSILRNPAVTISRRITSSRRRRTVLITGFVGVFALLIAALVHFMPTADDDDDGPPDPPIGGKVDGGGKTIGTGDRTASEIFLEAREAMFEGNLKRAREDFGLLLAPEVETIQPTKNWARFNNALCAMMSADSRVARFHLMRLREDARFSEEEKDAALCDFFEKISEALSKPPLPTPGPANQFGDNGNGALGLFAAGLAHWQVGKTDLAIAYFEKFNEATPEDNESWLASYQALTTPFVEDYELISSLSDPAELDLKSAESERAAVTTMFAKVRTQGTAPRFLNQRAQELDQLIQRLKREAEIAEAERLERARREEINAFLSLVRSMETYRDTGQFTDARKTLMSVEFESPELQAALEDQIYLWQTGEEFMNQILIDLNSGRFTGTVRQRSGATIEGTVTAASRTELRIKIGLGETRIEMAEIPPDALIEIANSISDTIPDSTEHYRRQELIVVYAKLTKQYELAKQFGDRLMAENRAFRERWTRILEADADQF